jgi:Ankyrin repeats (many copies)/Ankyrin repeat
MAPASGVLFRAMNADTTLIDLLRAIAADDTARASVLLAASPELARAAATRGATRRDPAPYFLDDIRYQLYAGVTALHVAAAGFRLAIARELIARGADVRARNRRGAEPLHAAAIGAPGAPWWDPLRQVAMIGLLIEAGADPNARDLEGVAPLHRAVRTRSAAATEMLLMHGAAVNAKNKSGSTPLRLAMHNTGRSGSGSPAAKAEQATILRLLRGHGATL